MGPRYRNQPPGVKICDMRTILGLTGMVLLCAISYAQPADAGPTFEVASVKAAPPPNGGPIRVMSTGVPGQPGNKDPGRFTTENYSISNLITLAYGIPHYRLSAPPELNRTMFNIQAKMPTDTTKEQFRLMLQNLLAERFGLKVHWETRPMEVYELVVAKGGPKLKDAAPDPPQSAEEQPSRPPARRGPPQLDANGFPVLPPDRLGTIMMNGKAAARAHAESAEQIADRLAGQIGHPVTDATGLTGKYDYTLYWADSGARVVGPDGAIADDEAGPNIFTAIQEQLGLKLESRKGQVQVLVVDHVEKTPTEN